VTPEEEVQRGLDAERLLREPLLVEAFEKLEKEYTRAWQTSPARDAEGREKLFQMQKCLSSVQLHLKTVMQNGQFVQKRTVAEKIREAGRRFLPG